MRKQSYLSTISPIPKIVREDMVGEDAPSRVMVTLEDFVMNGILQREMLDGLPREKA